jgi:hypothetical protein
MTSRQHCSSYLPYTPISERNFSLIHSKSKLFQGWRVPPCSNLQCCWWTQRVFEWECGGGGELSSSDALRCLTFWYMCDPQSRLRTDRQVHVRIASGFSTVSHSSRNPVRCRLIEAVVNLVVLWSLEISRESDLKNHLPLNLGFVSPQRRATQRAQIIEPCASMRCMLWHGVGRGC